MGFVGVMNTGVRLEEARKGSGTAAVSHSGLCAAYACWRRPVAGENSSWRLSRRCLPESRRSSCRRFR